MTTLSTPAHTPGPWYVGAMNDALFVIDKPPRPSNDDVHPDRDVTVIASVRHVEGGLGVAAANARLMAAAPELLSAAKKAFDALTYDGAYDQSYPESPYHFLWAAIKKAETGE